MPQHRTLYAAASNALCRSVERCCVWDLYSFADLHAHDVVGATVDAVLVGEPNDGDVTIWELMDFLD